MVKISALQQNGVIRKLLKSNELPYRDIVIEGVLPIVLAADSNGWTVYEPNTELLDELNRLNRHFDVIHTLVASHEKNRWAALLVADKPVLFPIE